VIVAPTAASDLVPEVTAGGLGKPLAAVVLGQSESVNVRNDAEGRRVPSYAYPENAVRALASAWSYGRWRARPLGRRPEPSGTRTGDAAEVVSAYLNRRPEGGWLSLAESMRLLECYGLPMADWRMVRSEDDAVRAAAEIGGHVALKADVPGVVHKSVVFGLGGVATDVLGDTGARLTPLTDLDATELVHSVRSAPLLFGHRGRPPVDVAGLRDTLLRLSLLADDHPDVAEVDLNPSIARPDGVLAVDARVRVVPQRHWDPYLRRLR
jgi:acyl-CoA synthetase (NDP forming)